MKSQNVSQTKDRGRKKGGCLINGIIRVISLMMISAPSISQEITIDREVNMLALGDSYTIGESVEIHERWPHQFTDALRTMGTEAKDPDYIATTGWTTRNLIQGISSRLDEEKKYNLVSILIGVNNQYRGIPVNSYEPDLRTIIDLALEVVDQDTSRVFILSIPDYAYTPFGAGNSMISREIDEYNGIKKRVAGEYGIAFINITPISREGLDNTSLVATDGLHPSKDQYRRWVEAVTPRLRFDSALPVMDPRQMPGDYVRVYPNPAISTWYIDAPASVSRISILNAAGSIVSDQLVTDLPLQLDISHLESGVYFMRIYHGQDDFYSHRILVVQG